MQQIMTHCFLAVKSKLECKLGYFDLIGCDFLIDDNFKVTLRRSGVGGPGGQVEGGGVSVHSLTTQTGPQPCGCSQGFTPPVAGAASEARPSDP